MMPARRLSIRDWGCQVVIMTFSAVMMPARRLSMRDVIRIGSTSDRTRSASPGFSHGEDANPYQ